MVLAICRVKQRPAIFILQHVYDKPATHRTGYPIMITVADAAGQTTSLQITVMIVPTGVAATTGIANSPGSNWPNIPLPSGEFWRYAAWPTPRLSWASVCSGWVSATLCSKWLYKLLKS